MKQDRPDEPAQAEMYVSFAQLPGINHGGQAFVVARTIDDPLTYVEALRRRSARRIRPSRSMP